jgi:hypothetical protein
MNRPKKHSFHADEQHPRKIDFYVINSEIGCGDIKSPKNTGTLIDLDGTVMGMLTQIPLEPGNIVELDEEGTSKFGVVMWSVESSNKFRVQVRFV